MLLLISPAKTLDFSKTEHSENSQPAFLTDTRTLVKQLKTFKSEEIGKLMGVSEKIANLNVERYQECKTPFTTENAKQALLALQGDVYKGMQTEDFDAEDLNYPQETLLILSGLYRVLRPFDLMQPYRLEMRTRLENERGKNLYEFWGEKLTTHINKLAKDGNHTTVVNLASNEYFKSVKSRKLEPTLLTINFKEKRKGVYKTVAFNAKRARGMMCRYAIKNRLTQPEALKNFDLAGYTFNPELSKENDWLFTREEQ